MLSEIYVSIDANHPMTAEGYGEAKLDMYRPATKHGGYITRRADASYYAIRGREQLEIEKYRRDGRSRNSINGISPTNDRWELFIDAALREFF